MWKNFRDSTINGHNRPHTDMTSTEPNSTLSRNQETDNHGRHRGGKLETAKHRLLNKKLTCRKQKTTPLNTPKNKISRTKGQSSRRTQFVREIAREVVGLAPYERRVIELLRNAQDKRARKLAKKRLGTFGRGKRKSVSLVPPSLHQILTNYTGLRTCRVLSPRPAVFRVTKRSNLWTLLSRLTTRIPGAYDEKQNSSEALLCTPRWLIPAG